MSKELGIVPLKARDAAALYRLLGRGPRGYSRYFTPFPFQRAAVRAALARARRDRYWGLLVGKHLAGFFMLRGLDAGYGIPSYGVYVAKPFANKGLSKLTLQYAESWCRLNGIGTLMLKCRPENTTALRTYKASGFRKTGLDRSNGNGIYRKTLTNH